MDLGREPFGPPAIPTRTRTPTHTILFLHPGYDDSNNVLLKLFAPDFGQSLTSSGLYAPYALEACGIIAGNRWDGWLSELQEPGTSERIDPTSILRESSYYFHLPPSQRDVDAGRLNVPYPIVPTFRDWRFPHNKLPDTWKRTASVSCNSAAPESSFAVSSLTLALQARDVSCRMTGYKEGTQTAHICPQKEDDWWCENGMARYTEGSGSTLNDVSNALLLRADIHIAFDKPKFVFVPKPFSNPENLRLATHLVEPSAEMEHLYHNRALHPVGSCIEMYFARFAWTIFPLLEAFLVGRQRRRLLLANEDATAFDDDGFVSSERCTEIASKRSRSPKKRKADAETTFVDDTGFSVSAGEQSRPQKRQQPRRLMSRQGSLDPGICPLRSFSAVFQNSSYADAPTTNRDLDLGRIVASPVPASHTSPTNTPTPSISPSPPTLKQKWLAQERLRSDPHNTWGKEKAWADEVWKGSITLDEEGSKKWMEICGVEVLDSGE